MPCDSRQSLTREVRFRRPIFARDQFEGKNRDDLEKKKPAGAGLEKSNSVRTSFPKPICQNSDFDAPPYVMALRCGWISAEDEQADRAAWEQRRLTSLQTCHRYSLNERPRPAPPKDSGA